MRKCVFITSYYPSYGYFNKERFSKFAQTKITLNRFRLNPFFSNFLPCFEDATKSIFLISRLKNYTDGGLKRSILDIDIKKLESNSFASLVIQR